MAIFTGTNGRDLILQNFVSSGVVVDPPGTLGTDNGESNAIFAGGGADLIRAGDDGAFVTGGAGRDIIHGGAGDDELWGGDANGGRDGADALYGRGGNDLLMGEGGGDLLVGGAGHDSLDGGQGADLMYGGRGDDSYSVDNILDLVVERANQGIDRVWSALTYYVLPSNVEFLEFDTTDANVRGVGNAGNNGLRGSYGDDRLWGLDGDDQLDGAWGGSDRLYGGRGDDRLIGGDGTDPDILRGQAGDDEFWANSYDSGADILIGGRGRDAFFFQAAIESAPDARVRIRAGDGAIAFEGAGAAAGDLIDLSNMDADETDPGFELQHLAFGGTGKGRLSVVEAGDGDTLVRANVDDDRAFEFQLLVEDGDIRAGAYSAADFILDFA